MSLVISFCTNHGIIMSGDRYITTTLKTGSSFCQTENEQKVFLSKKCYGFACAGSYTFKRKPASYWMERFIHRFDSMNLSLIQYLQKLKTAFYQLDNSVNIIIIGCGYDGLIPLVYSSSSFAKELTNHLEQNDTCIAFAGENGIAQKIIDMLPLDHTSYTLYDAVEFVKHVTLTVSNIQRFAQTPVTVGKDCDILCLTPQKADWIVRPPTLF